MIAAMMVATLSASAQFEPGTFSLQPKLGMNLSKVSNMPPIGYGKYTIDRSLLVGGAVGVEAEYQIAKPFSVAAALLFSMQGFQWEDTKLKNAGPKGEDIQIKDAKIELNYASIPVVANIYLFKGFAIKGGVQFGFLASANAKSSAKMGDVTKTADADVKSSFNKFDLSIPVGISYQVPNIPIYIDSRAIFGVTDIGKDVEDGDKNSRNQVFQLTVGYKFAL